MSILSLQTLAADKAAASNVKDQELQSIPLVLKNRVLARRLINENKDYALLCALKQNKVHVAEQLLLDETLPIQQRARMILQKDNQGFVEFNKRNMFLDFLGAYKTDRPDFNNNILHSASRLGASGVDLARKAFAGMSPDQIFDLIIAKNNKMVTPLQLAAYFGNADFIRLLLNSLPESYRNQYIFEQNYSTSFTALDFAAKGRNTVDAARALLEFLPAELHSGYIRHDIRFDTRFMTALHVAAASNNADMINFLIQRLPVNERDEFIMRGNNRTALFFAGTPAVVRALIEPLDPNLRNTFINHEYIVVRFTRETERYESTETAYHYKAWDNIDDAETINTIINYLPDNEKPGALKRFKLLGLSNTFSYVRSAKDFVCCNYDDPNRLPEYPSFFTRKYLSL